MVRNMSARLTREQEYELGTIIQDALKAKATLESGDYSSKDESQLKIKAESYNAAQNRLFEANQALVVKCAINQQNKFPSSLDRDDLIQEGYFGLLKAIDKYDPKRGNKFSTVAYPWIMQSITRGVNKTHRMVRLPENRISNYTQMNELARTVGKDIYDSEVIELIKAELDLTQKEIDSILNAAGSHASLNKPIGYDEGGSQKELQDFVGEVNSVESSESIAMKDSMKRLLVETLGTLEELEAAVILADFGFENDNGELLKPKNVREYYRINQKTYRETLNSALNKMSTKMGHTGLKFNDFVE